MTNVLWELPSPSSSFLEGTTFQTLPRRTCALVFEYEDPQTGANVKGDVRFLDVVAIKCTYLPALTAELIHSAYDKVVEITPSAWLTEVQTTTLADAMGQLRHLRICFDDGPCYDFLCRGFEAATPA